MAATVMAATAMAATVMTAAAMAAAGSMTAAVMTTAAMATAAMAVAGPVAAARSMTAAAVSAAAVPTVPARAAAPTKAGAPGIAAPIKSWTPPAVVIPAVLSAAEEELRLLDRQQLRGDLRSGDAVADRGFSRAGERKSGRRSQGQTDNEFPKHSIFPPVSSGAVLVGESTRSPDVLSDVQSPTR
jgi:hypothetical protein